VRGLLHLTLILTLIFGATPQALAGDDWLAPVYQFSYEWMRWKDCPDASVKELGLFPQCKHGAIGQLHQALRETQNKTDAIDERVTKEFFDHGAGLQLQSWQCQLTHLKMMTSGAKDSDAALTKIAEDLNHKLPLLRKLKEEITRLEKQVAQLESSRSGLNAYAAMGDPAGYAKYAKSIVNGIPKAKKDLALARAHFAAAMQGNPLGQFNAGGETIERLIAASGKAITPNGVWQAYNAEKLKVDHDIGWLGGKRSGNGFALSRGDREYFFAHGDPETWLKPQVSMTPGGRGLMCRMESRYGKGVQDFQTAMFVGSFAFWGAGLAIKGAQGLKVAAAAMGLRSSVVPAIGSAVVYASYPPTFAYAFKKVESECHKFESGGLNLGARCERSPDVEVLKMKAANCRYAKLMLVGNGAFAVVSTVPAARDAAGKLGEWITGPPGSL
jgi:uncharacterized protein (DUF697 family)